MIKKLIIVSLIDLALLPLVPNVSAAWGLKYTTTANTIVAYDSPLAADMNNDGKLDSLIAGGQKYGTTDTGIVIRYWSSNGTEVWRREYVDKDSANALMPIELYDVTNDGVPDVFCKWGDNYHTYEKGMICLNGLNGNTVWTNWDAMPAWHHFVILADKITNIPYVFFNGHNSSMNKMYATNGTIVKSVPSGLTCNGGISAADMDNDGDVEMVIGLQDPPGFQCYDTNLNLIWQSNVDTNSSTQCPTLVDVTGPTSGVPDGILDCVSLFQPGLGQTTAGITVVNGATGVIDAGMSAQDLGWGITAHSQSSVADFDGDGYYEMTTGYDESPTRFYAHMIRLKSPPELVATLTDLGYITEPPRISDLLDDNKFEVYGGSNGYILNQTFQRIPEYSLDLWGGMMNDIDNDGKAELFGSANGYITVYDTDKPVVPGINTYTAYSGYRRLNSDVAYPECPGTWWYTWAQWEHDHSGISCDAGGPYAGEAGQAIQFTGSADGGTSPYTWSWDFGDGSSATIQNPSHTYTAIGVYNVTLTVTDAISNTASAWTNATITASKPVLAISSITGGFGVKAVIKNPGAGAAISVDWTISLDGKMVFIGNESTGTEASIAGGNQTLIKSKLIFGFGKTNIKVSATCDEGVSAELTKTAFVLGFLILGVK